jgi:UDP-N-acetylmuramyl pentapeptide phosphotransferase/UDP-N-acetylglucosamine-1-phosphate transferase
MALRHRAIIDVPNERSSHADPTPRGLGLAPAVGIMLTALVLLHGPARIGFVLAGCLFGALGLLDDLRDLGALTRFVAQIVFAAAALPWLLHGLSGAPAWRVVFAAGCVVWLVAFVNAFNFMDGVNGISAAQCVVAGAAWYAVGQIADVSVLTDIGLITLAGALAFAPLNFPVAKAFIGDVGSYFFGAILAATAILGLRAGVAFEAVFAPVAIYLADTSVTIVRRMRRGEKWYTPHRSHVYQQLHQLGFSHPQTTGSVLLAASLASAAGLLALTDSLAWRVVGDVGIAVVLVAYLASPAWLERRRNYTARPREGK